MSLTSNLFFLFLAVCLLCYYLVPCGRRWVVLLAASIVFYLSCGIPAFLCLLYSAIVTYLTGLAIERIYARYTDRKESRKRARRIVILGMVLDFAMLGVLKYTNDILGIFGQILHGDFSLKSILLPLGISYYTFQTVSYILDVYWKRTGAEKNFFHYMLFVSFFPQLVQGPIGRYKTLMPQLLEGHELSFRNLRFGLMRMVWGLFKSMLLAGWAGLYRKAICADLDRFSGIAIFIVLLYSVELYGSFSGGIDFVLGIAELFGIRLDENFRRPYFSVSISDFWRRWHITLGTWMRDYVMYPLTLSRWMGKVGKNARKRFGKRTGLLIPMCISSIIVFFVVGLWHGAALNNIGWGLYNGVLIAASNLLGDSFRKWKTALRVNEKSMYWKFFTIIRTFILVNIGWLFDTTKNFGEAVKVIYFSFTRLHPSQFLSIAAGRLGASYTPTALIILGSGVVLLFIISLLQEQGMQVRECLSRRPVLVQVLIFTALLAVTALLSPMAAERGFIYAQY
ncbi:MBOAT family O-acyltransferase [Bilifractor sp. LCP19S3_H10]|uniref:MBOAT family O-acyltransferase n=1 Tax=Bilifractor sp. LCP19S3_H10 TaxID=3438736 RepID=UPI003F8E067D